MEIGPYQVVRELGRGGMGVVYEARDLTGRRVAVKVLLDPALAGEEELERFRREARACAQLSHPNLVQLLDVGTGQGRPYVVLEFLDGLTLTAQLRTQGSYDPGEAAHLIADLADGLALAHEHGVVHRDVKPANVIVVEGRPVLTDFGLARLGRNEMDRLTATGEILGTPGYMAPEQANGEPDAIDGRTDVYALGATLYTLLTGEPPHRQGGPLLALLHAILTEDPPPVRALRPDVPAALADLCQRCLARDPGQRPSARELAEALRSAPLHEAPWVSSRWLAIGMTSLVLLLVGLGVGVGVAERLRDPSPTSPSSPGASLPDDPASARSPARPLSDRLAAAEELIDKGLRKAAQAALERVATRERGPRWLTLRGRVAELHGELDKAGAPPAAARSFYEEALRRVAAGASLPPREQAQLLLAGVRAGLNSDGLLRARRCSPDSSEVAAATYAAQSRVILLEHKGRIASPLEPQRLREEIATTRRKLDEAAARLRQASPPKRFAQRIEEINHLAAVAGLALNAVFESLQKGLPAGPNGRSEAASKAWASSTLEWVDIDIEAYQSAVRRCQVAIDASPEDPRLHYSLGLLRKVAFEQFMPRLQQLSRVARDLQHPERGRLSQRFVRLRDQTPNLAGLESLDRALSLEPGYLEARHGRGWLLISHAKSLPEGRQQAALFAKGVADYAHVAKVDPTDARNHYLLGMANSTSGRPQEAIRAFAQVTSLDPRYLIAWKRRAVLCQWLNDPSAIQALRKDLERSLKGEGLQPKHTRELIELLGTLR